MNTKAALVSATALVTLSACADLGFGDFPLADVSGNDAGPVLISDLETTTIVTADGSPVPLAQAPSLPPVRTARTTTVLPPTPAPAAPTPSLVEEEPAPEQTQVAAVTPEPTAPVRSIGNQCFANIRIAPVTAKRSRQVLVSPATVKKETVPATYKTVTEQVLVSAATTRTERVPATYKTITKQVPVDSASGGDEQQFETVTERVLVTPAQKKTVNVPARYDTVTERVKVRDAYTEWRPSQKVYAIGAEALGGTVLANQVSSTGVMVLVEIPAEFKNETKRVLVEEATTREEDVPAVYETVTRRVPVDGSGDGDAATKEVEVRVVDQPATTRTVPVPAVYKTVTKRVIDTPAMTREVPVPAIYREEVTEVEMEPGRTERMAVVCRDAQTPNLIREVQTKLKARGLYDGRIDGLAGPATRAGLRELQGGKTDVLTMDAAKTLGLSI